MDSANNFVYEKFANIRRFMISDRIGKTSATELVSNR